MTFGFPARFKRDRKLDLREHEITLAVGLALDALGWLHERPSAGRFVARVPPTLYSWGEVMEVEISAGSGVRAESRCSLPTQCFDWGKNRKNVEKFFAQLDQAARRGPAVGQAQEFTQTGRSPIERLIGERG